MKKTRPAALAAMLGGVCLIALGAGCAKKDRAAKPDAAAAQGAASGDAAAFLENVETTYSAAFEEAGRIQWVNATYITDDTDWLAAQNAAKLTKLSVDFAKEAAKFKGAGVPADLRRKLDFITLGIVAPAPSREGAAEELAGITTRLGSAYSTGTINLGGGVFSPADLRAALTRVRGPDGDIGNPVVRQDETELLMRQLKDPAQLAEVWTKWNDYAARMKGDYARMVEIGNEGAKELGYADMGALWRSGYDMTPEAFEAEVDRLWGQVKPLYDQIHCYARARLNEKYGDGAVPLGEPIRADLLGNMGAQEWGSINDIVSFGPAVSAVDLDAALKAKAYDEVKMVKAGEAFFSSLGFEPLPDSFWKRSQIVKPRDREVVCHASAWDVDLKDDLRIKMCTTVGAEDFVTIHHELGHNYYQRAYKDQPVLFQNGANDGFHEAIGDMIALSITPDYMKQIGLIDAVPPASEDIGLLMRQALDKIAFLPFGLVVDKFRWDVFSGEITPDRYNEGWWALRTQYQGIVPPSARAPDGFDAGSKYHVPGNVPYTRYFLARILQFQFYKAACDAIGWTGPLHRCSFYGSKEVGEKLNAMLALGASKPWPEALEAFTGSRQMDGAANVSYFAPLMDELKKANAGRQCGW